MLDINSNIEEIIKGFIINFLKSIIRAYIIIFIKGFF